MNRVERINALRRVALQFIQDGERKTWEDLVHYAMGAHKVTRRTASEYVDTLDYDGSVAFDEMGFLKGKKEPEEEPA